MQEPLKTIAENWLRLADYQARCWVQGSKRYTFKDGSQRTEPIVANFSARFQEHPWVREAIAEGWDRDLRGHIVPIVRLHIAGGGHIADLRIEDLMPPKEWIEAAKDQARRYAEAEAWRKKMEAQYGSMEAYYTKTAHKRQQGASVGKAATKIVASLSERSLAMTGEAQ